MAKNDASETVRSEPDTLEAARQELRKAGYNPVKKGSVTAPNIDKIETWIGRGGVVYLVFNEFGWDVVRSIFGNQPSSHEQLGSLLASGNK